MDTDQREYQVCVSISDDGFYNIEDVQFTEEDIYVNIEDNLFGSLDALKLSMETISILKIINWEPQR